MAGFKAADKTGSVPEKPPEVAIGEEWAYRSRATDPVMAVRVVRIGTSRPARVLVRFVNEEFEGRDEWVPPNRLKVLWSDVTDWQAQEDRWEAVLEASRSMYDTPEYFAVEIIFEALGEAGLRLEYGSNAGVLRVSDLVALTARLGVDWAFLNDPLAFVDEDGTFVAPWKVADRLARHAAPVVAVEALKNVARSEEEARLRGLYGDHHPGYRGRDDWYTSPEVCAEIDGKYQPAYDLVRQWCGEEAVERHDELEALRAEVLRLGQVAERAIRELDSQGGTRKAELLRRDLGVPVELLRAGQAHRR